MSSGQPFVVLRPNAFMQTLIGQILIPGMRATGAVANALGTSGISFIDARDAGGALRWRSCRNSGTDRSSC